jgi:hypothetical protein
MERNTEIADTLLYSISHNVTVSLVECLLSIRATTNCPSDWLTLPGPAVTLLAIAFSIKRFYIPSVKYNHVFRTDL